MKYNFFLILFFFNTLLIAQSSLEKKFNISSISSSDLATGGAWLFSSSEEYIKGQPYLFTSWTDFYKLELNQGSVYKIDNLNYNVSTKQLVSQISKDSLFQFDFTNLRGLRRRNDNYKVYIFDTKPELCRYLGSIDGNDVIVRFTTKIVKGVINPLTNQKLHEDEYVVNESGLIISNETFKITSKLNKSNMLKLCNAKREIILEYIQERNVDFNEYKDVEKLIIFYNEGK